MRALPVCDHALLRHCGVHHNLLQAEAGPGSSFSLRWWLFLILCHSVQKNKGGCVPQQSLHSLRLFGWSGIEKIRYLWAWKNKKSPCLPPHFRLERSVQSRNHRWVLQHQLIKIINYFSELMWENRWRLPDRGRLPHQDNHAFPQDLRHVSWHLKFPTLVFFKKNTFPYVRAFDMMDGIGIMRDPGTGDPVRMRVGVHSGSVVAGVVGNKMPRRVPIRICIFLWASLISAIFWRWSFGSLLERVF